MAVKFFVAVALLASLTALSIHIIKDNSTQKVNIDAFPRLEPSEDVDDVTGQQIVYDQIPLGMSSGKIDWVPSIRLDRNSTKTVMVDRGINYSVFKMKTAGRRKVSRTASTVKGSYYTGTNEVGDLFHLARFKEDDVVEPVLQFGADGGVGVLGAPVEGKALSITGDLVVNGSISSSGGSSDSSSDTRMNFTGQHRCRFLDEAIDHSNVQDNIGKIVVATGEYLTSIRTGEKGVTLESGEEGISVNDSLPIVSFTSETADKRAFGVISTSEDFKVGSHIPRTANDECLFINSLGEGGIWICDKNGALENGDLIVTCEIEGYGARQADDIMRSCTVAKITMDCDFKIGTGKYKCEERDGVRFALVGCTYHCG